MSSIASGTSRMATLLNRRWPTPLLGVLVALFSWHIAFGIPSPGLDPGWWAGLNMAVHDGRQFGTEIIFSYGPLGFLRRPYVFYDGLGTIGYLYSSLILVAFASALVWTFRFKFAAALAAFFSLLIIVEVPMADLATPLAILWAFAVLSKRPPRHAFTLLYTGGAVFAAVEALVKLSSGPLIVAIFLLALIGARANLRQIGTFLGVFAASLAALWLIAGQHLSNLPDFAANSIQIVSGYNEAMGLNTISAGLVLAFVAIIGLAAGWAWFGEYHDRRAQIAAVGVALLVGLFAYKQGVVRADAAHKAGFLGLMAIVWVAVPSLPRFRTVMLGGVVILALGSMNVRATEGSNGLDVLRNLSVFRDQAKILIDTGRRDQIVTQRRTALQSLYGLPPKAFLQLASGSVSVEPWETAMVWAYNLDWAPLPVFQNYSAYTSKLDGLNSDAVASPDGPDRIVRPVNPGGIDGRFPGWDPPGQMIATTCYFVPTASGGGWQVLTRTENRCGPPVAGGVVESQFGEPVKVPAPGPSEIVYVKVRGAEVHGLERLRALLYKPQTRYATTGDGSRFVLAPDTAQDGLILRAGKRVGLGVEPTGLVPQTDTLELTGPDGDLSFEFFRMTVDRAGQAITPDP